MRKRGIAVLAVLVLWLTSDGFADVVVLKNGSRVLGRIVSRGEAGVTVETPSGTTEIPASDVSSIEDRAVLDPELRARTRALFDSDADGFFALSSWCAEKGLFQIREEILNWVIGIDPDHEKAREALGYFRTADGKWVKGRQEAPASGNQFLEALKLYRKKEEGKAIQILQDLLSSNPNSLDAAFLLGDIYFTVGKHGHAVKQFDDILKVDPNHSWALYGKALVCIEGKKFIEAEAFARKAIASSRTFTPEPYKRAALAEFWYILGVSLKGLSEGKRDDADKAFRESVALDRGHFRAWTEIGVISGDKGKFKDAYDAFGKALQKNSRYDPARYNWAVALYREGNLGAAMSKALPMTRQSPPYVEAYKIVGRCYHRQGKGKTALPYFEQYVKGGGKDPQVSEWIAELKK